MNTNLSNRDFSYYIAYILKYNGIKNICICPGSRNTPLILSFINDTFFNCTHHIDERSSAYFSLGISKASQKPSVVITTSGTAVANLLPAVIEADLSMAPLILLTADRPKSLVYTGENQTIKQDTIFKDFIRDSIHIEANKIKNDKYLFTKIQDSINRCFGVKEKSVAGPIHINISFDEPILDSLTLKKINFPKISKNKLSQNKIKLKVVKRPLIICGALNDSSNNKKIIALANRLCCPIFSDPTSQLRYHTKHKRILSFYDHYIDKLPSII